jgi:hypothetical protein
MSFGRRDVESWRDVQVELNDINWTLEEEDNASVKAAFELGCRRKLLTRSLVPEQQVLWEKLFNAHKLGGVDLIGLNVRLSGIEMGDLLDFLYVAGELINYDKSGEYECFFEGLFEYLQNQSSEKMDTLLTEYLGNYPSIYPSNVEPQLIQLIKSEELIRARLKDLLEFEYDCLTQAVIGEGVIRLLEKEEEDSTKKKKKIYIGKDDALKYLQRLMQDGSILDDSFVNLINRVKGDTIMFALMDKIISLLNDPINADNYVSGFDSVGAAVVRKLSKDGLVTVINSNVECLRDERLLALSRMASLSQISSDALMELLMERDDVQNNNDFDCQKRIELRRAIKNEKAFFPKLINLGIVGIFQEPDLQA